jgi:hypothetical protein
MSLKLKANKVTVVGRKYYLPYYGDHEMLRNSNLFKNHCMYRKAKGYTVNPFTCPAVIDSLKAKYPQA